MDLNRRFALGCDRPDDLVGSEGDISELRAFEDFLLHLLIARLASALTARCGDDQLTSELMNLVLELRAEARATKNWGMSDKIRDRLKALKVVVEDRPEGVTWRREA